MPVTPTFDPKTPLPLELVPGIHMVGSYYFNLFLVRGTKQTLLFETGVSGVVDRAIGQIRALDAPPDILVPSHPHSDHITGLPGLREAFPKARLLAGKGCTGFATHPKAGPLLIQEDAFISKRLAEVGDSPGRPALTQVPDLSGCRELDVPETLELGGITLELIPVQGHSPGNLMGWVEQEGILFCSDSIGFHYPGRDIWPLFFTGAEPYLESLERIREMKPEIICPAHQGPLYGKDARNAVEAAITLTRKMIQRLQADMDDDERLMEQLFQESYRDEFTLYTRDNIRNCSRLLIKRAREYPESP